MTERGLKNINVFIQRLQTFFLFLSRFFTFLTFLIFFWNVFYIYGLYDVFRTSDDDVWSLRLYDVLGTSDDDVCTTFLGRQRTTSAGYVCTTSARLHETTNFVSCRAPLQPSFLASYAFHSRLGAFPQSYWSSCCICSMYKNYDHYIKHVDVELYSTLHGQSKYKTIRN